MANDVEHVRFPSFRTGGVAIALGAALLVAGCSDDVTGPDGETGTAQAYMEDGSESALTGRGGMTPSANFVGSEGSYSGSFNADARVEISADGQSWVELGPPASVEVGLQTTGNRIEVHGQAEVPVGTYSHVRLVLDGAHANLAAGSEIGGIVLTGTVTMNIGAGGTVTVEKQVPPFQISAETRTEITWNLNSHLWVNEENAEEEEVEEEEFEEAPEPRTEDFPRES